MKDLGASPSVAWTIGGGGCPGLVGKPGGDVGLTRGGDSEEDVIDDDLETPGLVFDTSGTVALLVGEVGEPEPDELEETSSCSPRSRAVIAWPAMA